MAGGDTKRAVLTVLFTDIVRSTELAISLGDSGFRRLLDRHDSMLRAELASHGGSEVAHAGDGVVALFDTPGAAIRFGVAVVARAAALGLDIRVGLHTGELEFRAGAPHGVAVHIAARIGALAQAREVLVSKTVAEIASGTGLIFTSRGEHELKGVPGSWQLLSVDVPDDAPAHITVMVVDDHPLWRQTLIQVVEAGGSMTVVAEAADGIEAVALAIDRSPDVVLMDMNLPGQSGGMATAQLMEQECGAKVVMLSSIDDRGSVLEAVRAGASGYLLKTAGSDEVLDAIRRVHAGELAFPPEQAQVVLDAIRGRDVPRPESNGLESLTDREREVLELMAQGRSNQAIAERLFLASKSVEAYVARIFTKLNLEPAPDDHRRVLAVLAYLNAAKD